MMRTRTRNPIEANGGVNLGSAGGVEKEWELRPGGMLVQKRSDTDRDRAPPPTIRLRVKYGSIYHEVQISSQATFGELKKKLSGPTGLHHKDQKVYYKDRERDSKAFLDTAGVKDKSKIVLQEDPISQEKRYLEMRKSAKMEKAAKSISEISLEVDSLATQVSALESVISKGGKVAEKDVVNLIELIMNQLLKLDGITADGDVKLQRKMQVRRVQKYVETLDKLKIKNAAPPPNNGNHSNGHTSSAEQPRRYSNGCMPPQEAKHSVIDTQKEPQQPSRQSGSGTSVVITTQWEMFDSAPTPAQRSSSPSTSGTAQTGQPSYTWDLL